MACLVLHDIRVDRTGQRVFSDITDQTERREREPLDEHLHAEIREVPSGIGDDIVEQRLQIRVDRVGELELLVQKARVRFDVSRLVDDLRGRVELAVDVGHGLHDLGGTDQRSLFTVQEL